MAIAKRNKCDECVEILIAFNDQSPRAPSTSPKGRRAATDQDFDLACLLERVAALEVEVLGTSQAGAMLGRLANLELALSGMVQEGELPVVTRVIMLEETLGAS